MLSTVASAHLYTITGVPVAAEQESALMAKDVALSEGQAEAFNLLVTQLAGENALTRLPTQTSDSVTQFVQDVSIEDEKLTATRYTGHITVRFNPTQITNLFKEHNVPYLGAEPPSLLVIPVYQDGNRQYILDDKNPLYQALKQQGNFAPFYRAAVPMGDATEIALTEQALTTTQDLSLLEPLLATYQKDRIMILRMRTEPLEKSVLVDSSIWPEQDMAPQAVFKRFRLGNTSLADACIQMPQVIFDMMAANWRKEHMAKFDGEQTIFARIPVSSLYEWQNLEKEMGTWQFVKKTVVRGAYLPQMLVELSFEQSIEELKQQFLSRGWQLKPDFTGPGASLTKGEANE
ncbi:MAG: DUF2066 domain-containing protein [Alphaproteobacteria bacterium]|nr:DUF2066 domain-containing protein [Alphaproteobacteria bacterium]